MQRRRLRQR
ncbi:hypothetical protein PHMEG_00023477, partial [Phytophthora megakarya]